MSVYTVAIRHIRDGRSIITYTPILSVNAQDAQRRADELLQEYGGTYVHIREIGTKHQYSRTDLNKGWQKDF